MKRRNWALAALVSAILLCTSAIGASGSDATLAALRSRWNARRASGTNISLAG